MNVLFVHQNYPGQFRHLASALAADKRNRIAALCINEPAYPTPGVVIGRYGVKRTPGKGVAPLTTDIETKILRGEAAAAAALELKKRGFEPDVIMVHPGWGEHLFLKDVWPKARVIAFLEFFYRADGYDYGFDPEFSTDTLAGRMRLRTRNLSFLSALEMMDHGLSPTGWQKSSLPELHQPRVSVIFDGIDTEFITPDREAVFTLPDGRELRAGDEVLTFVNRNLEPYRGFHVFMRALPAIQKARPDAITLIVGGDQISYGSAPKQGGTWREVMLREVGDQLDLSRIVFLGRIPYVNYRQLLRVSRVHAYLTYPFVLSWSMLESMAAECLVIASSTPPVTEMIRTGDNGILVDFFDIDDWVRKISRALARPEDYDDIRRKARADILARYDLASICLPEQIRLVKRVAAMTG